MRILWEIGLISFKEGVRSRVLSGVLLVALLIFAGVILFSSLFMQDLVKVSVDFCLSAVSLTGLILTLFLGMNLLSKDLERRTIQAILSRPISRTQYVLGKYLGLSMLISAAVAILGGAASIFILIIEVLYPTFGSVGWGGVSLSILSTMGMLLLLLAVSLFFASFTSGTYTALMLTIMTYLVGISSENIRNLIRAEAEFLRVDPFIVRVVDYAYVIFPNLAAFDFKTEAAHALAVPFDAVAWLLIYALVYIAVLLAATCLIFQRRQFP